MIAFANFAGLPYWRLSTFYFFYFSLLGVLVPYLSLYLQALDFSARQIGEISAVLMATRIIAPNIWSWIGAVSGRRLTIIRLGALLAVLAFALIFWRQDFLWVCLVVGSFSFFWNAILAQFEAVTLSHLDNLSHYYSRVRLWGSVGFIVFAVVLGIVFQYLSIQLLPIVIVAVLTAIWLASLLVPAPAQRADAREQGDNFWSRLGRRSVVCFLIAAFLLQISHGSYYTFYSIYLEQHGYSRTAIGLLWGLGVVAEVVVFWFMHVFMKTLGPRRILLGTLVLTALRWLLIGLFPENWILIVFAQLLHAFSFGSAHAASIELIRRFFHGRLQGQGQALLSSVSFGAGGALGAMISGLVWDTSASAAYLISALAALVALAVVWGGLREE